LDIIVDLRGRETPGWDQKMRPVPPDARLVSWDEVLQNRESYGCIIAHNLTDLLDAKVFDAPRILVLHETIEGAAREQALSVPRHQFRDAVAQFVRLTGTHTVAVSELKARSWRCANDIVPSSANAEDYLPWCGDLAKGLRVANHVVRRPHTLLWNFHMEAFQEFPVTLVGRNPGWEGVKPAANWADLKETFRRHRFYIHTADPEMEDGYNMAMLEAMAAGLPVVGNRHPTSPIEHGVSGFLSNDPAELRGYARRLLDDRELAGRMGRAAQKLEADKFSGAKFREGFSLAIESAQRLWHERNAVLPHAAETASVS
jgi:glycosyltransferase involved in cell wall biosynthesis